MSLLLLGLFFTVFAGASWQIDVLDDVQVAFEQGNVKTLQKFFDADVVITLNGSQNHYSEKQAQQVLQNFLSTNKPDSFKISNQGWSAHGDVYMIGEYYSNNTKHLIYLYFKKAGSSYTLQELRID